MARARKEHAAFGINVIGFISGNLGLGVATRNTVRMLTGQGVPVALTDVDPGGGRMGHDTSYRALTSERSGTPYLIDLFHMDPSTVANVLRADPSLACGDRVSACVPFWELPVLPAEWLDVLDAMDIVLAPTRFVEATIVDALPDALCIHYPQAAFVPEDVSADRARWNIPASAVAFVSSFDINSDIERKNPEAAIAAFGQAFPGRDDVRLVLKINSTPEARERYADRLSRMLEVACEDPRVMVIDRVLDYADVLSLYASCDVLVSLHRSEGLGLSLMEAMSFGLPVVATGWSGNMDFMTPENSCPVGYDLVPVDSAHPSYTADVVGRNVVWAEPHVSEAAGYMRRLADDPELRSKLGEKARADMAETRHLYERGPLVDALKDATAPDSPLWKTHATKRAGIRRIAGVTPYRSLRRLAGRLLRRLGLRRR